MAKKYKDKKDEKIKSYLTNTQRKQVDDVEKYIDEQIDLQWESGQIEIDYLIVTFKKDPYSGLPITNDDLTTRRQMSLIGGLYTGAGWHFSVRPTVNPQVWIMKPNIGEIESEII